MEIIKVLIHSWIFVWCIAAAIQRGKEDQVILSGTLVLTALCNFVYIAKFLLEK